MSDALHLTVNGERHAVRAAPSTPLLYVLRNDLCLNGPKFGCGLGECGACMVLVDGRAARSCVLPVSTLADHEITTLEGLGDGERLDPVQDAFIEEQGAQCGYCLNGMIMTVRGLLNADPAPTREAVVAALDHTLCRCGTHQEILAAACRAAGLTPSAAQGEPSAPKGEPSAPKGEPSATQGETE